MSALPTGDGPTSGLELTYPARLAAPPSWMGHIPFAFWLINAVRPRRLVELGVHSGNSYCAFAEAAQALSLPTEFYGVDLWQGDEHAGRYSEQVYRELLGYHNARYSDFSTLLRSSFDDALSYFSDGSVDVLHIDGLHTYEAVKHDFDTWLPKVSERGVILFHDTKVREREFGVWRLWEEIQAKYPSFDFAHSHGLGVAYVGSEPAPEGLRPLLEADSEAAGKVRLYFSRLGGSLVDRYELHRARANLREANARLQRHAAGDPALQAKRAQAG